LAPVFLRTSLLLLLVIVLGSWFSEIEVELGDEFAEGGKIEHPLNHESVEDGSSVLRSEVLGQRK